MNPLELCLYFTFLIYSYSYKFELFVIYILLLIGYTVATEVLMKPDRREGIRHKLRASTYSAPSEGPIRVSQELDVTKAIEYAKQQSRETGSRITLTHVVARALGLGLDKFPEIQGHLKFGNFDKHPKTGVTIVVNVGQGEGEGQGEGGDNVPVTLWEI